MSEKDIIEERKRAAGWLYMFADRLANQRTNMVEDEDRILTANAGVLRIAARVVESGRYDL